MSGLTQKQIAFIDNYLKTLNGSEAARRAKYKGNSVTLAAVAYENLKKPHIREEIQRRLEELQITDSEIIHRLGQQSVSDMGDALHIDGNYVRLDIQNLKDLGLTHLIKKFKQTKQGMEIELYDSQAALIHLFKLRRLIEGKPTAIVKLEQAIQEGKITQSQVKERYPQLAEQFFADVDR